MKEHPRLSLVWARRIPAFLALFSGTALLMNILLNIDLRLGLAVLAFGTVAAFTWLVRRAGSAQRRGIGRALAYGAVAGVLATLAYDVARVVLSILDPSPYRPFEAIVRFGQLLLGTTARDGGVMLAGSLFHTLNGASFGIAFTFAVVRNGDIGIARVVLLGMAWGMFLEAFQMALYPNWLGIQYLREFLTISALGHLAYGATLGPLARTLLRRSRATMSLTSNRRGLEDRHG